MKKTVTILFFICFVFITGCSNDKGSVLLISDVELVFEIKHFEHLYISRSKYTKKWIAIIQLEDRDSGIEIDVDVENKNLKKAVVLAIEKALTYNDCINRTEATLHQ